MKVERRRAIRCKCEKPSIVSHDERDWFCGRCGGTLPADLEPDPALVKSSGEIRGRAQRLDSLPDFEQEFGRPKSILPRESDAEDVEMLAKENVVRQAIWEIDGISLFVRELVAGEISYVIGW